MVILLLEQQARRLRSGQQPAPSHIIAVDRKTGKTVWKRELISTTTCYGVPAIFENSQGTQIVAANTGNGLFGIEPTSGEMLWNLPVFNKRCCSSPLIVGDLAIGSCGSGGGGNELVAVKIPSSSAEKPEEVYRMSRSAPYVPTSAVKDNRLFTISDKGIASCLDAMTGETLWSERIGGNFGASPIVVGDKMLVISLDGNATVLSASDKFEELGQVDLKGRVGATPAYAQGHLLIRVNNELRCLKTKN